MTGHYYTWKPSALYQDTRNLIVILHIRRDPGVMIYVYMREPCAFKKEIFDVANFTTLAPS